RRSRQPRRVAGAATVPRAAARTNRKRPAAVDDGSPMTTDLGFEHVYQPAKTKPGQAPITLLLLHGTGGNEHDLIPLGRSLAADAGVLSPRGNVLEPVMPRFFRRLSEGVFDLEDLQKRTHELADFVANAASAYHF